MLGNLHEARMVLPDKLKNTSPLGNVEIRCAGEADVDAIVALINDAFRVERFFLDRDRVNRESVSRCMSQGKFLLAVRDDEILGCVHVELNGDRGYFGLLAVDPSRQGMGLGRHLVEAVEAYFRAAGCRFSDMQIVNVRAELPEFYRRLGYVECGTEPFTEGVSAIPCHFVNYSKLLL